MAQSANASQEFLLKAALPELFRENAFRLVEMPVDCGPRDLAKRQKMIEMAGNTGMTVPPGQGRALPLDTSSQADVVREAMQRLRDPERRLIEEFFWFWPHRLGQSRGDEALTALARGEVVGAGEIWLYQERYRSEANVSVHNLAVLCHAAALDLEHLAQSWALTEDQRTQRDYYWQQAYHRWRYLLACEGFWVRMTSRIRELDDPRLKSGTAEQIRTALPLALTMINARMAVQAAEQGDMPEAKRHVNIVRRVSGFEQPVVDEALQMAVAPIRDRVKTLCSTAGTDANADPAHADIVARRLLDQTEPLLDVLDCMIESDNPTRTAMHDEVARKALQCQIAFGNETKNWRVSQELLERTLEVPATESVRAQIKENLDIVKGNLEYDLCFFCKRVPSVDTAAVEVKMFGDVTRTPTPFGVRVQWKNATIRVPRCIQCQSVHGRASTASGIGGAIGAVLGLVGCTAATAITSGGGICVGLIVWVVLSGIGAGIGTVIGRATSPPGVRPESDKIQFPPLAELKRRGWQLGEKPNVS